MVVNKRAFLSINYTYSGAPEKQEECPADIVSIWHCPLPVPGAICREAIPTLVIDLTQSLEEISSRIEKRTRQEIRRAEHDQLVFGMTETPGDNDMNAFFDFYDAFAAWKNLRQDFQEKRLVRFFASSGLMRLSKVSTADGKILTWHAYLMTNRAALLMSASNPYYRSSATSAERQLAGRANRFHRWQDIRYFKEKGLTLIDFCGWYSGNTDLQKLNINRFKEEFGGKLVKEYKCWYGVTVKGKLFLRCWLLLDDLHGLKRKIMGLSPLLTQYLNNKQVS